MFISIFSHRDNLYTSCFFCYSVPFSTSDLAQTLRETQGWTDFGGHIDKVTVISLLCQKVWHKPEMGKVCLQSKSVQITHWKRFSFYFESKLSSWCRTFHHFTTGQRVVGGCLQTSCRLSYNLWATTAILSEKNTHFFPSNLWLPVSWCLRSCVTGSLCPH